MFHYVCGTCLPCQVGNRSNEVLRSHQVWQGSSWHSGRLRTVKIFFCIRRRSQYVNKYWPGTANKVKRSSGHHLPNVIQVSILTMAFVRYLYNSQYIEYTFTLHSQLHSTVGLILINDTSFSKFATAELKRARRERCNGTPHHITINN